MSDLFPKEILDETNTEASNEASDSSTASPPDKETKDNMSIDIEEKEEVKKDEDMNKPFVDEETDVEIKPKKKKRQLSEKQLNALAKAREKSKLKRMKLAEARNAEAEAKKEEKRKIAAEKRKAKAEKKAAELAEIDAFQIVKEKQYSFTKDELNELLDNTIDRHETKRKKRKEEEKRKQQPMVNQAYPYAMPHVAVPQPYPIHQHPAQPPPLSIYQMNKEQIQESRKKKENKKNEDFMNEYFGIN